MQLFAGQRGEQPEPRAALLALQHAGVGMFELRHGQILLDDSFLLLLGFQRSDLPNELQPWVRELVHPEDRARVGQARQQVLEGVVETVDIEYRMRNSAGGVVWVRNTVVRTEHGVIGTVQDITHFKTAQEKEKLLATQLQQTNQRLATDTDRLRTILDHAPVMIDAFNENGRCVLWNRECERQLGFTFEEMRALEAPMDAFYPDPQVRARVLETIIEADGTFNEFEVRAKDGAARSQRWANFRLPSGEGISVGYDVSESNRQAEQLAASAAKLEETVASLRSTNKELEEFAYVVSHDLQAPLRHIRSFIRLIHEDTGGELPGDATKWFDQVDRAAVRMQLLIRDLLAFCRADRAITEPEAVDLAAMARELADEHQADGSLEVNVGELPVVHGYRAQLEQLFQNLIENAARYCDASRQARLEISARTDEGKLAISFADNGIGIDPRHHQRIFNMFQRLETKRVEGSTGIGLAVCRKIARLHGGDIEVRSAAGDGATFIVTMSASIAV